MILSNPWGAWFTRSAAVRPVGRHQRVEPIVVLPGESERPWGCGWFDSSLDLREGLAVIEHASIDLGLAVAQMLAPPDACH